MSIDATCSGSTAFTARSSALCTVTSRAGAYDVPNSTPHYQYERLFAIRAQPSCPKTTPPPTEPSAAAFSRRRGSTVSTCETAIHVIRSIAHEMLESSPPPATLPPLSLPPSSRAWRRWEMEPCGPERAKEGSRALGNRLANFQTRERVVGSVKERLECQGRTSCLSVAALARELRCSVDTARRPPCRDADREPPRSRGVRSRGRWDGTRLGSAAARLPRRGRARSPWTRGTGPGLPASRGLRRVAPHDRTGARVGSGGHCRPLHGRRDRAMVRAHPPRRSRGHRIDRDRRAIACAPGDSGRAPPRLSSCGRPHRAALARGRCVPPAPHPPSRNDARHVSGRDARRLRGVRCVRRARPPGGDPTAGARRGG